MAQIQTALRHSQPRCELSRRLGSGRPRTYDNHNVPSCDILPSDFEIFPTVKRSDYLQLDYHRIGALSFERAINKKRKKERADDVIHFKSSCSKFNPKGAKEFAGIQVALKNSNRDKLSSETI